MKTLTQLFPNASQSVQAANPQLSCSRTAEMLASRAPYSAKMLMNKTESEFAQKLEIMKLNGEILRYEYEGITLRWAGIRYTPDFVVFGITDDPRIVPEKEQCIKFIEVKGAFIGGKFERAVERFRHARTYWPEFTFEMWQKTDKGWIKKM